MKRGLESLLAGLAGLGGIVLLVAACKRDETASKEDAGAAVLPAPSVTVPPETKATTPRVCPPPAPEKLAPFECSDKIVKTPVPPIVDPKDTMARFYERLAQLARGTATERVRIGIYGDSNLTSDLLSGHLRRVLQARFGDAGHGWISLSRPWGSYRHEDVESKGFWPMFELYTPTTHVARDKEYGFANMAAESKDVGAAAWAGTTKDPKAPVGHSVNHFELFFLKQPHGGSFDLLLDRKTLRTVNTRSDAFEAGFEVVDAEEGPHEIRAVVKGDGPVRLFGTSLDRVVPGAPGVQIDSLGAGALNYERLASVAEDVRRPQLARRAYDLVVLWLGMNVMFVPPNKGYTKAFIASLRAALPTTPILVLTPGDTVREGETKSDPRIVEVARQMRDVAAEEGTAFWDFREAMGGDGSIVGFTKRGLTGQDHIHFGPEGSHLMGQRLLCAMWTDLAGHVDKRPDLGCPGR